MRRRKGSRGVTLIELCFGLALVALLAGLATPTLQAALRAAAVRTATYELLAGLEQTRASAIVEARTGLLCPSGVLGTCHAAATPSSAWRAWLEVDGHPVPLAEVVLPAGIELRASRSPLKFWPNALAASTGTLTICDLRGIATPRAIIVSQSGRARVAAATGSACQS